MVGLYPNEQYMLKFTNEEIKKYLIEPAELHEDIVIYISAYGKKRAKKQDIHIENIQFIIN